MWEFEDKSLYLQRQLMLCALSGECEYLNFINNLLTVIYHEQFEFVILLVVLVVVFAIIVFSYLHKRHHEYKMADIEKAVRKAYVGESYLC